MNVKSVMLFMDRTKTLHHRGLVVMGVDVLLGACHMVWVGHPERMYH